VSDAAPAAPAARPRERHPARGYALAAAAAAMWALNGSLGRFLLDDGVGADRLSQVRSVGSWLILLALLGLARPDLLRVRRDEIPALAFLGIAGLAFVHATYFLAIDRLQIGAALTIQYLAPLLLLLWLRFVHGRSLAPALWGAVALSI
jgi:drug/metabolite transporter (DMT)-like permease